MRRKESAADGRSFTLSGRRRRSTRRQAKKRISFAAAAAATARSNESGDDEGDGDADDDGSEEEEEEEEEEDAMTILPGGGRAHGVVDLEVLDDEVAVEEARVAVLPQVVGDHRVAVAAAHHEAQDGDLGGG